MAIKELSNVQIKSGSDWYKLCPFPVGYIYMGYTSTSPATTYGGTWSSISGGRYFRAAAANDTAGSNTITTDNMPSHSHQYSLTITANWYATGGSHFTVRGTGSDAHDTGVYSTTPVGGGEAFYPTYQNVYAWRRTA